MACNITTSRTFDKEVKRLSKRYHSIVEDLTELIEDITKNPQLGTDLGGGLRKIRMRIASKGRGKSGGARVISFTIVANVETTEVNLLFIYDKAERSSLGKSELEELLRDNGFR